jgi:aromatic ring-opening dioxygenase LigB subunit
MVLSGIYILPHGCMILDCTLEGLPKSCHELHTFTKIAGESIRNSEPDKILLITPHGISLSNSISIYNNSTVSGSAEWNGHWSEFVVTANSDAAINDRLFQFLSDRNINIEPVTAFSKGCAAPLAWGEVVPLWFCRNCEDEHVLPPVSVLSFPTARARPFEYAEKAIRFGEVLAQFVVESEEVITLVFSCDLSHVHCSPENTLPLYCTPDPTLSPNPSIASEFDGLIQQWITTLFENQDTSNAAVILEKAKLLATEAKTCGWSGFCSIQGIFQTLEKIESFNKYNYFGKLLFYSAPTYYGMMVATYSHSEK